MTDVVEKKKPMTKPKPDGSILDRIFGTPQETMRAEMSEAENIAMIIKEWLDPKHIKRKTRLTKKQVIAITIL